MQVKKKHIRDNILAAARQEFTDKGFAKASLRDIARSSQVTKGAIYGYFKSKDALFCELVEPTLTGLLHMMASDTEEQLPNMIENWREMSPLIRETFQEHARWIQAKKENLQLLFFRSSGSSVEDYRERVIAQYTDDFHRMNDSFGSNREGSYRKSHRLFIHSLASLYLTFIQEIISNELDRGELEEYVDEIAVFVHLGLVKLWDCQRQQ